MATKRPFLIATLTIGALFAFFLLVIFAAGMLRGQQSMVSIGQKIGVLEVTGTIDSSRDLLEQIKVFRRQDAIKAVVLRIDSPGGAVGPAQEIFAELQKLAAEKPLIVSMGGMAASGGYYLALAGEQLFASPGTITGSIGVIMSFPDYQGLMDKVGVGTTVVKSGRFKDIGSTSRDMSAADRRLLQDLIDDVHEQFVEAVQEQRQLSAGQLEALADGRIMTGRQALQAGLIDALGTFNDATDAAARRAGIDQPATLVYPQKDRGNFLERYLPPGMKAWFQQASLTPPAGVPLYLWRGF